MLSLSVIVPTYRRPKDLLRCLRALAAQVYEPLEIIVVVRDSDRETRELIDSLSSAPLVSSLPLSVLTVTQPGVVAAMSLGLEQAAGEIVAFTDDDAAPHPDWLQRIESHFKADTELGAVGGKDILFQNGEKIEFQQATIVGKLQWFGRTIGNHHRGIGNAREVEVLKGVNMSYRRTAIESVAFDIRLKGDGAQVCNDMAFSLAVHRSGWKVIYDPNVAVDHYPAPRFDEDKRNSFSRIAFLNRVHNETLVIFEFLNIPGKMAFFLWSIIVGTKDSPGFLQLFRLIPSEGILSLSKWKAALLGRFYAYKTFIVTRKNSL